MPVPASTTTAERSTVPFSVLPPTTSRAPSDNSVAACPRRGSGSCAASVERPDDEVDQFHVTRGHTADHAAHHDDRTVPQGSHRVAGTGQQQTPGRGESWRDTGS